MLFGTAFNIFSTGVFFWENAKIMEEIRMTWPEEIKWNLTLFPEIVFYMDSFFTLPAATQNSLEEMKWNLTQNLREQEKPDGRDNVNWKGQNGIQLISAFFPPEVIDHLKMKFN